MNYIREVADLFLARCRGITILDPMDYAIIAEWEKRDIPLAIVLTSINEVFDSCNGEQPKIESVSYFQDAVKRNFRDWLQTQTRKR